MRRAAPLVAAWAGLLLPPAVILYLVLRYAVNVPSGDQWDFTLLLAQLQYGTLTWSSVWEQHNEHRIVFPKLIMFGLAPLTRWNTVAESVVSIVLALGSLGVLVVLMRPVLDRLGPWMRAWALGAVSLILFSLVQWENWVWGWQIAWFLAQLAAISAIALAVLSFDAERPVLCLVGAAVAAIVCHYTLASGVAIWPVVAIIFAWHPGRRWLLPLWLALGAASVAVYFVGYKWPASNPSVTAVLADPVFLVRYVGNYLSGPLGRRAAVGVLVAAAFVAFAVVALARHRAEPRTVLPWIAIGLFAGATAGIASIGRITLGAEQGLSSRYATFAGMMSVALIPLGILAFGAWPDRYRPAARRAVGAMAAAGVIVLALVADARSRSSFVDFRQQMTVGRDCLRAIDDASDDCLRILYPNPVLLRERAMQLWALGWTSYAPLTSRKGGTVTLTGSQGAREWRLKVHDGRLGRVDGIAAEDGGLVVRGWAIHPDGNDVPRRVLVALGGRIIGEAEISGDRGDVAAALGNPRFVRSGWTFKGAALPPAERPRWLHAFLVLDDGMLAPLWGATAAP